MNTITKIIGTSRANGDYIEARVELRIGHPTLSDGFSVTGAIWERRPNALGRTRKARGEDCDAAGQITEDLHRAFPKLHPVMALHLANPAGVPMYAKENGWYFYSGEASKWEREQVAQGRTQYAESLNRSDHERAAEAIRVTVDELPTGLDKAGFETFVDSLTGRYQTEATAARAIIESLPDGFGVV